MEIQTNPFQVAQIGDVFEGVVAVMEVQPATTKTGKPYARLTLCDCLGDRISLNHWDITPERMNQLQNMEWAFVRAGVTQYNGSVSFELEKGFPVPHEEPENWADFLPAAPFPLDELRARFDAHLAALVHPHLRALLDKIFSDTLFLDSFEMFPAAKERHHAFRHGLLQHTVEVADTTRALCIAQEAWKQAYISADLAVAGALLHDIGKVSEFEKKGLHFAYSVSGNLLGHTTQAITHIYHRIKMLNLDVKKGIAAFDVTTPFPQILEDELLHIVASHHGRGEWGAHKPPMTPEAALVHFADKFSSEMAYFAEAQQKAAEDDIFYRQYKLDSGFGGTGRDILVGRRALPQDAAPEPVRAPLVQETPISYPVLTAATLPIVKWHESMETAPNNFAIARLPLLGKVAAGQPLFHTESSFDRDFLIEADLPRNETHFLLRVEGESMTGDGVESGDLLVVRSQSHANPGDIVVARIGGDAATVKRFAKANGKATLVSSNPAYPPIPIGHPDDLTIQGRVIAIARA